LKLFTLLVKYSRCTLKNKKVILTVSRL